MAKPSMIPSHLVLPVPPMSPRISPLGQDPTNAFVASPIVRPCIRPSPTVKAPTKDQIEASIDQAIAHAKNSKLLTWLGMLCQRWDDERGYESFDLYEAEIKAKFSYLGNTITVTRRPFGLWFKICGVKVAIKCIKKPTAIAVTVVYRI